MRVVFVGAGVIGLTTAVAAVQAGMDVTIVDAGRGYLGSASAASGAMLGALGEVTAAELARGSVDVEVRVRAASCWPDLWRELQEKSAAPAMPDGGTVVIATTTQDQQNLEAIIGEARRLGVSTHAADPATLQVLKPVRPDAPIVGCWLDEGWIDSNELLTALDAWLTAARVDRLAIDATRIATGASGVAGVELVNGDKLDADQVVLCAGVATSGLLEASGLSHIAPRVVGGKGVSILVRGGPPLGSVMRTPNREFACGIHAVPRAGGQVVLGATNRLSSEATVMGQASLGELRRLLELVELDLGVAFDRADLISVAHGHRPVCVDGRPLVGLTEIPGLALATGTNRCGVLLAPLVAAWIVEELATGAPSPTNPYGVVGRVADLERARNVAVEELSRCGGDLLDWLSAPNGQLAGRSRAWLKDFLGLCLAAILGGYTSERLDSGRALFDMIPLPEGIPEAFLRMVGELDEFGAGRASPIGDGGVMGHGC